MTNFTEVILEDINIVKLTQPALAQVLAMAIMWDINNTVDWKAVNKAIVERWSKSARERVLTMAWKIVEQAREQINMVTA